MARCCTGPSLGEAVARAEAAAIEAEAASGFRTFYGFGAPGAIPDSKPGDNYVDLDTGTVYVLD